MSSHASAELLSAYIDRQLARPEASQLAEHLETCSECHVRLDGLHRVVASLQNLHQVAPPSTLEQTVARRIALAEDRVSLLDRLEQGLSLFSRQSPVLALFAVVIALGLIIYTLSYAVHQSATIPVIFQDPPSAAGSGDAAATGSRLSAAGRELVWSAGGLWVEEGLSVEAVSRTLEVDSQEGRAFFAAHPELADLAALGTSVVIAVDGEVVRLD